MKSIFNTTILLVIAAICVILGMESCKQPAAPKAEVIVMDSLENRVADATVVLMCTPITRSTCVLGDTATTDSDGISEHEVEYESVLQIYASKTIDGVLYSGESFIKMELDKTAKETVVILAN